MKIKKIIKKFFVQIFYDKKYLTGKHFESIDSEGWNFSFKCIFFQKIIGVNRHIPWPINFASKINKANNIFFDNDDLINFQSSGCYFQNFDGKIKIGLNTFIAPNVGIITANHNIYNLNEHNKSRDVNIGNNCWIGMNSTILPGVILGNNTIVGAGSVVTKSFEDGYCVIAGNPAKVVKKLINNQE